MNQPSIKKEVPDQVFENSILRKAEFVEPFNKNNVSTAYVEILFQAVREKVLVIISDVSANQGRSVINGYEYMATQVYNNYLLEFLPDQVTWIEHDFNHQDYALVQLNTQKESYPPFLKKATKYTFTGANFKHISSIEALRKLAGI